jgi:hypothetical protein
VEYRIKQIIILIIIMTMAMSVRGGVSGGSVSREERVLGSQRKIV